MSTSRGPKIKYTCFNDCVQTGCRGHEIQYVYHHTSDVIRIESGGEIRCFDPDEFDAMLKSYEAWKKDR